MFRDALSNIEYIFPTSWLGFWIILWCPFLTPSPSRNSTEYRKNLDDINIWKCVQEKKWKTKTKIEHGETEEYAEEWKKFEIS